MSGLGHWRGLVSAMRRDSHNDEETIEYMDSMSHANGRGCVIWDGPVVSRSLSYGRMWFRGKKHLCHRVAYILYHGEICDIGGSSHHGTVIMHTCDNPLCINPMHLAAGTQLDNILDRGRKNRTARMAGRFRSFLSSERELCHRLYMHGWTQVQIADFLSIRQASVSAAIRRIDGGNKVRYRKSTSSPCPFGGNNGGVKGARVRC